MVSVAHATLSLQVRMSNEVTLMQSAGWSPTAAYGTFPSYRKNSMNMSRTSADLSGRLCMSNWPGRLVHTATTCIVPLSSIPATHA